MKEYKAPQKEFSFILDELIDYDQHCTMPGFEDASRDVVDAIIPEAAKFYEDIVAPTNHPSDREGTLLSNGTVVTASALEQAYMKMIEGGWVCLNGDVEYGGAGLPNVVDLINQEMSQSSNMSLGLLPMLSRAAMHALSLFGSPDQKSLFLGKLISGVWSGTMNLTEPQAGSDLSCINCKAIVNGDHFLISGQKIYITWGDHELSQNVVHLVLARIEGAPDGNHGISLFIVPKYLVNDDGSLGKRNDLRAVGLEHKLGIHASPTCTMAFGDNEGAIGYLVGEENRGLSYMFAMMNNARLAVGHQGVAISERAYQRALAYASQRVQGRAVGQSAGTTIINHPDVKRMLMQMRAITEAGRALSFFSLAAEDRSKRHPDPECREQNAIWVEILTPLVKGWCTEMSMESTSLGVQVHGGMGFVEESGAAQYMRDSRILPIYEGTNGIQALDFIGRKCLRDGGAGIASLLSAVDETINIMDVGIELVESLRKPLISSLNYCRQSLSHVLSMSEQSASVAVPFLMLFGNTLCYWQLCRLGYACHKRIEKDDLDSYYTQKIATTKFFATHILSRNKGLLIAIMEGDESLRYAGEDYFNC